VPHNKLRLCGTELGALHFIRLQLLAGGWRTLSAELIRVPHPWRNGFIVEPRVGPTDQNLRLAIPQNQTWVQLGSNRCRTPRKTILNDAEPTQAGQ
jgi:hypothetical protein